MEKRLALIIEDDLELGEIFSDILQLKNFETVLLRDGQVARDWLTKKTADVVVLDMHLPYISGRDILNQIHTSPHLTKMKVMVVTADAILAATLDNEADIVLVKPLTISQLSDISIRLVSDLESNTPVS